MMHDKDLVGLVDREVSRQVGMLRDSLASRDAEVAALRAGLESLQEELRERDAHLGTDVVALGAAIRLQQSDGDAVERQLAYLQSIHRLRAVIAKVTPRGARILVVGKGDAPLVCFAGRTGLHFPQDESGAYPGHTLSDLGAIAHLESLRVRGADYLVVPPFSSWWLEHFSQFAAHLETRYERVHEDPEAGVVYALAGRDVASTAWGRLRQEVVGVAEATGHPASVLDWESGLDVATNLPGTVVVAPTSGLESLPHADASIDFVVVGTADPLRVREARRVAARAVVVLDPAGGDRECSIEWIRDRPVGPAPVVEVYCLAPDPARLTAGWISGLRSAFPSGLVGTFHAILGGDEPPEAGTLPIPSWMEAHHSSNPVDLCNRLAGRSSADWILFVDVGLVLLPGAIARLMGTFDEIPGAGLVGGKILASCGYIRELGLRVRRDGSLERVGEGEWACEAPAFRYVQDVPACSTGLAVTPRALLVDLGGLDGELASPTHALAQYATRVGASGRRVLCQPAAVAVAPPGPPIDPDPEGRSRAALVRHLRGAGVGAPPRRHVLVVSHRLPEFDRECGSKRVFDHIEMLRADWSVTFLAMDASGVEPRYVQLLRRRGVATFFASTDGIEEVVRRAPFDVAIVYFWHVAEKLLPVLRRHSPSTRVIVDSVDFHFLRTARQMFRPGTPGSSPRRLDSLQGDEAIRELNCYADADAVLTVSDKEAGLIGDFLGNPRLAHSVPLCGDAAEDASPLEGRRGILFVGNFLHQPNAEAVEFLCREVLPRIDPGLLARHPVTIVGNRLDDRIRSLAGTCEHVRMVGWVPTLEPYLRAARISVAPLLHGAGTKGKVVQSLNHGLPVVTTPIGAEGLALQDRVHALVATEPAAIAAAITELLTDDDLWNRISAAGRIQVSGEHSHAAVKESLDAVLRHVRSRPPAPAAAPEGPTSPAQDARAGRGGVLEPSVIEEFRPRITEAAHRRLEAPSAAGRNVLVLGIYLADKPNNVADIVAVLEATSSHDVTQSWTALGGRAPSLRVAAVTGRYVQGRIPKFQLLNEMLAEHDLDSYDHVLLVDDDVVLPHHFLDSFLSIQNALDFSVAQPARTSNSYIDLPIVEQQGGLLARRTRFVEIGPVVSVARSSYGLIFPFDASNEMGWGYENVWARMLEERGLRMGIVDATPVDHSLRKSVAHYSWKDADAQRTAYLATHPHLSYDECFVVLEAIRP